MKKRLAILITLCMAVGVTACGAPAPTPTDNSEADTTTSQSAEHVDASTEATGDNADSEENTEASTDASIEEDESVNVTVVVPDEKITYRGKDVLLTISNPDENGGGNPLFSYGDISYEDEDYAEWLTDSYIIDIDDTSFYVLLQPRFSNDWATSCLLKFDGNNFSEVGATNGGIYSSDSITAKQIVFETRVDLFGTYGIKIPMKYSDAGFEQDLEDGIIYFVNEADPSFWEGYEGADTEALEYAHSVWNEEGCRILVLKHDLIAYDNGEETVIDAGERIKAVGYNGEEHRFYFSIGEKLMYFIYDDSGEYSFMATVNGISQEDMFVNVMYAG